MLIVLLIAVKAFHVSQVNALAVSAKNFTDTLPPSNPLMRPDDMYKDSAYSKDSSKSYSDSSGTTPNYNDNIRRKTDSTNKL